MDLLVDAQVVAAGVGRGMTLKLRFAAPRPASVGASDWAVEPYEVPSTGDDAVRVLAWLRDRASDLDAASDPEVEAMVAEAERRAEEGGRS